jgi:hypothetical protein
VTVTREEGISERLGAKRDVLKQCLTSKENQSQAVLDSIKENDFHGVLKRGKTMGSLYVYVPNETILKERAAEIE